MLSLKQRKPMFFPLLNVAELGIRSYKLYNSRNAKLIILLGF